MHPADIKAALEKAGLSYAKVARTLGVSRSLLTRTVRYGKRSKRVEAAIAKALGKTPAQVFPERYGRKK